MYLNVGIDCNGIVPLIPGHGAKVFEDQELQFEQCGR